MTYDRMGRRVTKNAQRFVYNGYLQIANFRSTTTTSDYNCFVWDVTEPIATRPLVWMRGISVAYYTHDGNKNVSEIIAADGSLAARYEYAPFGEVTVSTGSSAAMNPWRFSSEYADDELGCDYYNYREYEPVMGRWMRRDPIGETLGGNLYTRVESDAQELADCLGLRTKNVNGVMMFRTDRLVPGCEPEVNDCGSGWNAYLVPDADYSLIGMLFGVDFEDTCNRHDKCYGTCAENKNKFDCDLKSDMKRQCEKIPHLFFTAKVRCKMMADIFYTAVDRFGGIPFEDAQDDACVWECCGLEGCGWRDFFNALPH